MVREIDTRFGNGINAIPEPATRALKTVACHH
jgi:hypothetical protein